MNTGEIIHKRYRIEQMLGQGNMGITYKALDLTTQRPVVLKQLHLSHAREWKVIELFEREAKILKQLNHPQIPTYIDSFTVDMPSDVQCVLIQAYIEGKTLQQLVEKGWHGSEREILDILQQLVNILEYLHTLCPPVIHRDINPKNIICSPQQKVYLVDFGAVQERIRTTFLGGSTVVGTFGYMPFEQFTGQVTPASDYYALGATLLYLLTHRHPADFPKQDLHLQFQAELPQISPTLLHLLERLLEPAVEDRLASPDEFQALLQHPSLTMQRECEEIVLSQVWKELKPPGKKITTTVKEPDCVSIRIPGSRKKEPFFAVLFWLGYYGLVSLGGVILLFTEEGEKISDFSKLGAFVLALVIWVLGLAGFKHALYELVGSTVFEFTPQRLRIVRKYFDIPMSSRSVPTEEIRRVEVQEAEYTSRGKTKKFDKFQLQVGAKTLQFTDLVDHLSQPEKDWLCQTMRAYVSECATTAEEGENS